MKDNPWKAFKINPSVDKGMKDYLAFKREPKPRKQIKDWKRIKISTGGNE